jgi:hypothetical protein
MPVDGDQTSSRSRRARADAFRDAALLAGVSLDGLVRTGTMSRPKLIGAGLLLGGAVVALAHVVGADLRALAGSHLGLLQAVSDEEAPPRP